MMVRRLASWRGGFDPVVLGMPARTLFPGVAFHPVRPLWFAGGQTRRYAAGVLRALQNTPPALVEVHNRPELALILAQRLTVPVTLFLHNDPQGMRGARSVAERKRLLERLACVVTVSEFLRSRLLEGIQPIHRPRVLPNCLDLREVPPSGSREDLVLFAGRVVADKGADVFVRACALALPQLPGWRAEMIGADRFGPGSPETPFMRTLRPSAASAGVTMSGWRPHTAVLGTMARAAIVIVPSRWQEPFGLTALEAMACGTALLCAPRGGLAELMGDAALPIDADDPDCVAAAIVALARDPARRAALGEAGRLRAASYDLPRAGAALDALRRDVLAAWSAGLRRPI
jgi:glycosyltransferase involved in cell wall biosynthesis